MVLHIVQHPLASKILTDLRDISTDMARFRNLGERLTYFLVIEATGELGTKKKIVNTPLAQFDGVDLAQAIVIVPILRAGLVMLQPVMNIFPEVAVGYIGLQRDKNTGQPGEYYYKMPELKDKFVVIIDPMLATGHSAELAIKKILAEKAADVVLVSMIAAPEGIHHLENAFPDIEIFTAAVDDSLDEHNYILPGLGDFGDRAFGTN